MSLQELSSLSSEAVHERPVPPRSLSANRHAKKHVQRSVKLARIASARSLVLPHPRRCRREPFLSVVLPRQHQHLRPPGQRPAQQLQCLLPLPSEEFVLPLGHLQRLLPQRHRRLPNRRFLKLLALRRPLRTLLFNLPSRRTSQLMLRPRRRNKLQSPLKQRLEFPHSPQPSSPHRRKHVTPQRSPSSRLQLKTPLARQTLSRRQWQNLHCLR